MSNEKQACIACGVPILATTAARNGGQCIPCARGTRTDIEQSRRREAAHRQHRRINEEARTRILQQPRPTLGDFLQEDDPLGVLWPVLVDTVFSTPDRSGDVTTLSDQARILYLVQVFDGEVHNGGFHQYFSNSSGNHTHDTQRALFEIGAVRAHDLLARAVNAFPEARVPVDRMARYEQLEAADKREPRFFDGLDKEYYALARGDAAEETLPKLLLAFMRQHGDASIAA